MAYMINFKIGELTLTDYETALYEAVSDGQYEDAREFFKGGRALLEKQFQKSIDEQNWPDYVGAIHDIAHWENLEKEVMCIDR